MRSYDDKNQKRGRERSLRLIKEGKKKGLNERKTFIMFNPIAP